MLHVWYSYRDTKYRRDVQSMTQMVTTSSANWVAFYVSTRVKSFFFLGYSVYSIHGTSMDGSLHAFGSRDSMLHQTKSMEAIRDPNRD